MCLEALPSRCSAISVKIVAVWKKPKRNKYMLVCHSSFSVFFYWNKFCDWLNKHNIVNSQVHLHKWHFWDTCQCQHIVYQSRCVQCSDNRLFFLHILLNTENKNRVKTTASKTIQNDDKPQCLFVRIHFQAHTYCRLMLFQGVLMERDVNLSMS